MALPKPFYRDEFVTLYHGDAREIVPQLEPVDAVITDPPYGQTNLVWDRWVDGWPDLVAPLSRQLWCCGSFRMFWDHRDQFCAWSIAQDLVWEKHNGSSMHADRFRRVHELILHFYQGRWKDLHRSVQTTPDALARTIRRKDKPVHWKRIRESDFVSLDGGPRLMRSVIRARSCHGHALNETQKPPGLFRPLINYSVPPSGCLLDPFCGAGTSLLVAREQQRRAIGIEIRLCQCEAAAHALAQSNLSLAAS